MAGIAVDRNDRHGTQFIWRGVLITIRPNRSHGISGSIGMKDENGKLKLVPFHGEHPEQIFPLTIHEEEELEGP